MGPWWKSGFFFFCMCGFFVLLPWEGILFNHITFFALSSCAVSIFFSTFFTEGGISIKGTKVLSTLGLTSLGGVGSYFSSCSSKLPDLDEDDDDSLGSGPERRDGNFSQATNFWKVMMVEIESGKLSHVCVRWPGGEPGILGFLSPERSASPTVKQKVITRRYAYSVSLDDVIAAIP